MICESCGSKDVSLVKSVTDFDYTQPLSSEVVKVFELFKCNKCGYTFKIEKTF